MSSAGKSSRRNSRCYVLHKEDIPKSPPGLADHLAAMRAAGPCKAGGRARAFLRSHATVDNARVRAMIDIASGDAVEPGVKEPICRCS